MCCKLGHVVDLPNVICCLAFMGMQYAPCIADQSVLFPSPHASSQHTSTTTAIANKSTMSMTMTITALLNSEGQFSGHSTQKDHREHCKTLQWQYWFDGSQPL